MKGGWLDVPAMADSEWEKSAHLARYAYAAAALPAGAFVADAACGMGYGTHMLDAAGLVAEGWDLDPEAIALARDRWRVPGLLFYESDISALSFRPYGALVSFETLEHLDDPWAFVDHLAPEILICSAPIIPTLAFNRFHRHEWNEAGFRALIERRYVIDDLWRQRSPMGIDVYAVVRGHRK